MITPPTIRDLAGIEPLVVLRHDEDLAAQLRPFLFRLDPLPVAYWLGNLAILLVVVRLAIRSGSLYLGLSQACMGMVMGYLLLLPLHEGLHALAYRLLGCAGAQVIYRWRTLTAFCVADRVVLAAGSFSLVCLAPSLLLNPLLGLAVALTSGVPQLLTAGALLLHLGAASGDLALLNLLWVHRGRGLYTYDDVAARVSCFVSWPTTP